MSVQKAIAGALALAAFARDGPIAQPQDFAVPPGISPFGVVADAITDEQNRTCTLDDENPTSWAISGAENLVKTYLDGSTSGSVNWLKQLSRQVERHTTTVDCRNIATKSCSPLPPNPDCTKENYPYFMVRMMSSRINELFTLFDNTLDDSTINSTLATSKIISAFKLLEEPPSRDLPKILTNVALVPAVLSAVTALIPGGGPASAMFGLVGATLGTTKDHLKADEVDIPKYEDLAEKANDRLRSVFVQSKAVMSATLAALFGDETALVNMGGPDAWKYVIGNMSVITGKELDRDAKHLILEILKGGELIRPITNNTTIIAGMKGVFASVQQSLIGTILAESHVFVEQEMPAYNEGSVPCEGIGKLKEGNSCLVIKRRNFGAADVSGDPFLLEEEFLKSMIQYGMNLEDVMQNVMHCNNEQIDPKDTPRDKKMPTCFYAMPFAQRANEKDHKAALRDGECTARYINQKGVPEWITDYHGQCANEIPKWSPCTVTFQEIDSEWGESPFMRHRVSMKADGIDLKDPINFGSICEHVFDTKNHCPFGQNPYCGDQPDRGLVFEISVVSGAQDIPTFTSCMENIGTNFARENRCEFRQLHQ